MKKISDLLGRFTVIQKNSDDTKEIIFTALRGVGIALRDKKNITVKGNTVFLKIPPTQKSDVFLKQSKILALLKNDSRTAKITRVR